MCKICPLKVVRNGKRLNRDIACQCISIYAYRNSLKIDLAPDQSQ